MSEMIAEVDFQDELQRASETLKAIFNSDATFQVGETVMIDGLTNATHYNGRCGVVTGQNDGRFAVKLAHAPDTAQHLSVRSANLSHFGMIDIADPSLTPPSTGLGGPLGGTRQTSSRISTDSAHGQLQRLPISGLPSLPSKDAEFDDTRVGTVYRSIYKGHLFITWKQKGDALCIEAHDKDALTGSIQRIVQVFVVKERVVGPNRIAAPTMVSTSFDGVYETQLTENQSQNLATRVLHLLIRTRGNLFGYNMTLSLGSYLWCKYSEREQWKELVDACIVVADVAVNTDQDVVEIGWCMNRLGEALESQGRFRKAAEIYEQAAQLVGMPRHQVDLYNNCGLAYKRNKNYQDAERAFVMCLHANWKCSSEVLSHKSTVLSFTNLMFLYSAASRDEDRDSQKQELKNSTHEAILLILLHWAGYTECEDVSLECEDEMRERVSTVGKQLKSELKTNLQSKQAALEVLRDAMSDPDVECFRSKILSCIEEGKSIQVHYSVKNKTCSQKKLYKETARQCVQQRCESATPPMGNCYYPECCAKKKLNELKSCPCKTVSYCGKSCQIAHWQAEHKNVCPFAKKK